MKKVFLLTLIVGSLSITSFAQNGVDKSFYKSPYKNRNIGSFDQGTGLLSFGLGFPNVVVSDYGYSTNSIPTLYAKYEHGCISDEIGIGGHLAFSHGVAKYRGFFVDDYKLKITAVSFAVLGYYHFNKLIPVRNLDVYAGAGLTFRNVVYNYDNDLDDDSDFDVYPILKVGARYYVKRNFGFYVETGFDRMSSVNLGITFRF